MFAYFLHLILEYGRVTRHTPVTPMQVVNSVPVSLAVLIVDTAGGAGLLYEPNAYAVGT